VENIMTNDYTDSPPGLFTKVKKIKYKRGKRTIEKLSD